MAPTPPTIVSLKQSFLTSQTRLLSQPLTPTRAWRNTNTTDEEDSALPEKAIDDALFKLNHRLQQHARRVYAPQATRHVAEQIDQLYWNAAEAATQRDQDDDDGEGEVNEALTLGADLASPTTIAALPSSWDTNPSSTTDPATLKRYTELSTTLHSLAAQKQATTARVARLRRMQALLAPFSPGGDDDDDDGGEKSGNGVQENLVTRNGEVEVELQRMRMLLARVGGRVGMLKEKGSSNRGGMGDEDVEMGEEVGVEMDEQRKVGLLLGRF